MRSAVALFVLLGAGIAAACGGLGESAAGSVAPGSAGSGANVIQVSMTDDAFDPATLQAAAGQPVTFEVHNDGQASHNFTIEALNLSTGPMQPGDVISATVTLPAGRSDFVCTWHTENGMVGQIDAS